ncbi:hypothetical protein Kpol_1037p46 [Vanderwaltozyma polyspora DSM 70294]|uniref:Galactokinase n=1 Tax=Vanderwaltozyma polyspora (strain ATCC 22028 / DSM 70294 / BCRC 21397 / CBS 2163 / NBRC 10782 / NRRL Y-8283 / UCD 57-17) TaxID=436907 RepID=A7TJY7_VANPO|nr:uncharacterized protein Kpol_1037p46 [Vanderwaltozyma polyspora DSM 70294]EDO17449.1 hypothetical protein Kpol_1037p46 [Vanderwaltozyma polyspora DSM 70294]
MSVPFFNKSSEEIPLVLTKRTPTVIEQFTETYGVAPDFITRSPGRVNLIGEHIDYCDFSVLPMAIDVDMVLGIRVLDESENSITISNSDKRFVQRKFDLPLDGSFVNIDPSVSDWSNYFKCGLHVAHEFLKSLSPEKFSNRPLVGMEIFCDGNVPTGGGLSSSAAFICATALAIIRANMGPKYVVSKQDLMRITVVAEHYVGVNNGGMDQAASVCGEEDHVLYVEFKPQLKATPFKFPQLKSKQIQFVIANSLVVSNKHETAPTNYNLRVVEVTIAANLLATKYGVSIQKRNDGNSSSYGTLRDFMNAYYARYHGVTVPWDGDINTGIERLEKMVELVEQCLGSNKEGFTVDEIAAALNISREAFTNNYLTIFPVRFQVLKLYQRARHVYTEALRVLKSIRLLTSTEFNSDDDFFTSFGNLMNQSQESCDKFYECSCQQLNEICEIALANGSFGSRLTGAGWGGCSVHLVPAGAEAEKVKKALIDNYYKVKFPNISESEIDNAIIISKPTIGSCVYEL